MADYISREAALDFLIPTSDLSISAQDQRAIGDRFEEFIESIPAADVRPVVRGEWLAYPILDDMCYQHYSCSVCKRVEAIPHGYDVKKELPFCHCGADMREEGSDV